MVILVIAASSVLAKAEGFSRAVVLDRLGEKGEDGDFMGGFR
jgi:hypothetical protein